MPRLAPYMKERRKWIDSALRRFLQRGKAPSPLQDSMIYSVTAPGKRLRPILTLAAAEACGLNPKKAIPTACAMELIHTYSLIHDDLPAMDNDDLRRGKPTNHKVFGEAMALLAGDGLLTRAFELMVQNSRLPGIPRDRAARVVETVAQRAGPAGMVGGQALELAQNSKNRLKPLLNEIHRMKTAALITASLEAGAILAGAPGLKLEALTRYGQAIGMAFQIMDDLSDMKQDKSGVNYSSLHGAPASHREALKWTARAHQALAPLGAKAGILHELADWITNQNPDRRSINGNTLSHSIS